MSCRLLCVPPRLLLSHQGWRAFTAGLFLLLPLDGNHLWPLEKASKAVWLQAIADQLARLQLAP